eukprot:CAMPEP_0178582826 /NCGR_PEP_ID=MMETSP0697-20121206/23938_1 /TAXON_ID=265572 /ORGANISM="Extubocellulus spinifer, Strain CCMP396" /LENGTH=251 /DNA_ID=CAMNT_0020218597 /DNA_START=54 /DNA_END=809 /DNA_ORIENTATION=-
MKLSLAARLMPLVATAVEATTSTGSILGGHEYDETHSKLAAEFLVDYDDDEDDYQIDIENIRILGASSNEASHAAIAAEFLNDAANFQEATSQCDDDFNDDGKDHRRAKRRNRNDRVMRKRLGGKRLKMYCEERFKWQDERVCHSYCLEVDGDVEEGDLLRIMECSATIKQKFKLEGHVLRPAADRSLCVKSGKLKRCDTRLEIFGGNKFEIHNRRGDCFTQVHHPKPEEPVEFRECRKARNSHSNLWKFA